MVPQWVVKRVKTNLRFGQGFPDKHFNVGEDQKQFNLNIIEIQEEDTGTYFCAELSESQPHYFVSGTLLIVEGKQFR